MDELSDGGGGDCLHPPEARTYYTALDTDGQHVLWAVTCGECGEPLAQGADRV